MLQIIAILIIIIGIITYNKWSYKKWYERCRINSKHPNWKPYCGIDFIRQDPQWFIDNGYEKHIIK